MSKDDAPAFHYACLITGKIGRALTDEEQERLFFVAESRSPPGWRTPTLNVGHVSPAMLKTYSHIRRQALNQAAATLEPSFHMKQSETNTELIN